MRGHPARLELVVELGGADGCNVDDWGSNNQQGCIPERVGYGVHHWWRVWPKYCTTLKGEESAAAPTAWFWVASWPKHIHSYEFSVEWLIDMKKVLHFIWIGFHLFVVASLATKGNFENSPLLGREAMFQRPRLRCNHR
jgi:hypothetical protein